MEVINNSKLYKDLVFKVLLPLSKSMKSQFCEMLSDTESVWMNMKHQTQISTNIYNFPSDLKCLMKVDVTAVFP